MPMGMMGIQGEQVGQRVTVPICLGIGGFPPDMELSVLTGSSKPEQIGYVSGHKAAKSAEAKR